MAAVSKSLLTMTTLAIAMIFGGGVYVMMNLSTLAKPVTERIATEALGVKVSIGKMDVSLQEKRVSVGNIRIANPQGFSKPHAVTVEGASVTLADLSKTLVGFKSITVSGTQVFLEVKEGSTNLHALKSGMKQAKPKAEAEPVKVIVDRFAMQNAQLNPSVTLIGDQDLQPVLVPDIVLTGVGRKENGVLAHEAIAQIMDHVLKKFSNAAGDAGFYQGLSPDALQEMGLSEFDRFKSQMKEDFGKVGEGIKKLFQ